MSGMLTHFGDDGPGRRGCGPLIAPLSESMRPLRQQVFERVRASGLMPRVQVAKELGVSPASVTTITSELIELGLLHGLSHSDIAGVTGLPLGTVKTFMRRGLIQVRQMMGIEPAVAGAEGDA